MATRRHSTIIIFLYFAVCSLFACNSPKTDIGSNKVVFGNAKRNALTYDTFNFSKTVTGSQLTFSYDHPTKRHILIVDTVSNYAWFINEKNDTTMAEYNRTHWLNDKEAILKVYEYLIDKNSQDGEVVLYISPQVGLISQQSLVWRLGSYLKDHPSADIDIQSLLYYAGLNYPRN